MLRLPSTSKPPLNDKYLVGDEIGKGAYGKVYKGLDLENGDFVAIKQVSLENIPQDELNSIMQEIDLLKNLNHKNIVKYQGSFKANIYLYIILEYVESGSLASMVKPNKFGAFPESLVAVYIAQVLEGLVYLHEQGVIHRDIKGANILTTKQGLVKLADFGVATKLTEADHNTHSVVGTPYWMAPEVIEMSGVCAASDIWSVGCTVIELLTCVPPYYDLQPMPALFRIVQDEQPPIPEHLSPGITDFLHQCFRKDAKLRPDANTLLKHPWIQNTRSSFQSSLKRSGGRIRGIPEDVSTVLERTLEDGEEEGTTNGEKSKRERFDRSFGDDLEVCSPRVSDFIETVKGKSCNEEPSCTSFEVVNPTLSTQENRKDQTSLQEQTMAVSKKGVSCNVDDIGDPAEGASEHLAEPFKLATLSNACNNEQRFNTYKHSYEGDKIEAQGNEHFFLDEGRVETSPNYANGRVLNESNIFSQKQKYVEHKSKILESNGSPHCSQSIEVSKLVNMLNPEESEDKIVLACQDLLSIFRNHPVQKSIFVTQHGVMPLMEMLEQTNNLVRYSVLQVVNVLMKDNASLQVNACLVGFIPVIMNLAGPDHSKEMRMQAAYFVQQLCQTSSLTLQMFIACHGLPVLVGFLEHDYAKYREMVFLAIDCMWQVIRLQSCTPRNEFYWIFAKNGVLLRLVNALHSLNEATQLDSAAGSGLPVTVTDRMKQKAHSAPLEFSRPLSGHIETRRPQSSQLDPSKVQFGQTNLHSLSLGAQASSRKSTLQLQKCSVSKADAQYSLSQNGKIHSVAGKYKPAFFSNSSELASSESMCNSTGHQEWPALMPEDQLDRSKAQSDQTNLRSLSLGARASSRKSNLQLQRSFTNLVDAQYRLGQIGKIHSVAVNSEPAMFSNSSELASSESMSNSTEHHEPTDRNAEQLRQSHSNEKKYFMEINGHIDSSHAPGGLDNTLKSSFFRHGPVQPLLNVLEKEPPSRPVTGPLEYIRYLSGGLERPENIISLLHNSNSGIKTNGELNLLIAAFTENGREREAVELCSKSLPEGVASTSGLIPQAASGLLSGSGILNAIPGSATSSCSLSQLALTLSADMAREYLEKVSDLLLEFSQASTTVKSFMCNLSLLIRLFQILNKLEPPILVKILKCTNRLSTDPNALENLQRADAMKHLIPFLKHCDGPLVSQIHVEVINTLYNLCKINKRRQEQAAENGIIPHLMHFISTDSPLKQVALPLLCDMAHASRSAREQLRIHDGLGVYLSLLNDEAWAVPALDSLAVCLAYDIERRKVEEAFFKKEAVQKLVIFFQHCSEQSFVHILEPFLKIITKSTRINTELATNGLTPLLIARLDHQDAIVRLNLLKLIKAIYEHHPRPKQLILENDLPFKLLKLIEERKNGERSGGQVLVKQMATSLLKALHINTVL